MIGHRLVTPLRTAARDLIEKRLWPIAVLLIAALVAVPVLMSASGSDAPSTAPVVAPSPASTAGTGADRPISVAEPVTIRRSRPGPVHDPFYDPPAAKSTSTSASTVSSPSTPSPSTSTASAGGDKTAPAVVTTPSVPATSGTPTTQGGTSAPGTGASFFRTRLSFGSDATAAVHGVSRLQPLGDVTNPALLYLGTTKDHTQAVFLLGPNALADGEGKCADEACRVIKLKPGQSTVVSVVGVDAGAGRYTLAVDAIAELAVDSEQAAAELRIRVHPQGRDALRAMIKDPTTATAIGQFTYDRSLGAVVPITAP
jgi:hypothetical protein